MATSKNNKQSKGTGGVAWGDSVRSSVDVGRSNTNKDESDVSITLVLCIAIMALTFVIAIPLLGMAYLDMHNATNIAIQEIKKMRLLRAQILEGINDNRQSTEATPTEESVR
jgi:hypothetical protein